MQLMELVTRRPKRNQWLRYQAQHRGLALALFPLVKAYARILRPHLPGPTAQGEREFWLRFDQLLQTDFANAEQGFYPSELLFEMHLGELLARAPRLLVDGRARGGLLGELFFHGAGDILRRMTIPHLVRALRGGSRPRIVDIGCASGRLLLQTHRALPNAELVGLDLSEPSIARARSLLRDTPATLIAVNAERTSLPDASFDAASIFGVLHEMPREGRLGLLREARRLLKPGGLLVVSDVLQCNSPTDENGLGHFITRHPAVYHEPHYQSYLSDPLEKLLSEAGFAIESREQRQVMEVVAARS